MQAGRTSVSRAGAALVVALVGVATLSGPGAAATPAPVTLKYTGEKTASSGTFAKYGAKLTNSAGIAIKNAPITFLLGHQDPTTKRTSRRGVATGKQQVIMAAGRYTLRVSYPGTDFYAPASIDVPFTVTPPSTALSVALVGSRDGGGEPSLATGPEGNLYVSYPGNRMSFYRSTDRGATWHAGGVANAETADTSVNVDSSGAVYQGNLLSIDLTPDQLQAEVWKSTDHGSTWPQRGSSTVQNGNATGNPFFVDRPWTDAYIPPGKTSDQALVYLTYHDFGPSVIWVTRSSDGGRTFGLPVDVLTSPQAIAASACNTIPGGVKVVQSGPHAGRVYVTWLAADAATNPATGCNLTQADTFHSVWAAWSDDRGATWTDQLVYDAGPMHDGSEIFADLTLDSQGNPYVAFVMNITAEFDMYVMASFDGGATWNGRSDGTATPYNVDPGGGTHFFPAIAVSAPGKVDVAFLATPTQLPTNAYGKLQPGAGAGASWKAYFAQSLDLLSGRPTWSVTPIRTEPVHVGDICNLGLFCAATGELGSDRSLLDFIDISIDKSGYAHVAYTDDHNTAGIYAGNQISGPKAF